VAVKVLRDGSAAARMRGIRQLSQRHSEPLSSVIQRSQGLRRPHRGTRFNAASVSLKAPSRLFASELSPRPPTAELQNVKRNQIRGLKLNASVARAEQERPTFLGGSDRLISFTRETIVKLFKNASRWSWQDNDFIYQNFISSLSQCCHCFWESRAFHNHSLDFDQHIITFVSPLKAFCFNRWCHIQLRNKFPAPIMSIMSLFPDQIVSTHHMDFVVVDLWLH
jgi:hypothetical protein